MIGGFLGAGKTTTIARLASHFRAEGKNVANQVLVVDGESQVASNAGQTALRALRNGGLWAFDHGDALADSLLVKCGSKVPLVRLLDVLLGGFLLCIEFCQGS